MRAEHAAEAPQQAPVAGGGLRRHRRLGPGAHATELGERVDDAHPEATRQLQEYFDGERRQFSLPLAPRGTEFQRRVWAALAEIPYGETRSYGELATALGRPGASRAVGMANGRNPISIVVPCHRVVGANGSITGYAGGVERKVYLLDFERQTTAE